MPVQTAKQGNPQTIIDFERQFRNEEDCKRFLEKMRWPEGYLCSCGGEGWKTARGLWKCMRCGKTESVTTGTMFHGSHLSLMIWFRAMWWMTNQRTGVSAMGLQNTLGLGSYRTAWSMLKDIRKAMSMRRRPLSGLLGVGICNFSIGEASSKIAIVVEEHPENIGRIRMRPINEESPQDLMRFIYEVVAPGSSLTTDSINTQNFLSAYIAPHTIPVSKKTASRIKIPIALVRRWMNGTHQGRCETKYLQDYLEEFSFRFNRRHVQHADSLFLHVMEAAIFDWKNEQDERS